MTTTIYIGIALFVVLCLWAFLEVRYAARAKYGQALREFDDACVQNIVEASRPAPLEALRNGGAI